MNTKSKMQDKNLKVVVYKLAPDEKTAKWRSRRFDSSSNHKYCIIIKL